MADIAPPVQQEQPWSYGDVMTMHEMAKSRGQVPATMTLPEFAQHMNGETGSNRFSAGITSGLGGLIKQTQTGIDEWAKPASDYLGEKGAQLGGLIGPKTAEIGRETGEGLPRMAASIAPLALAGAAAPIAGPVVAGALTAAGLGEQAAQTYIDTGSPAAAAVSAATLPLMGKLGSIGAEKIAPYAGKLAGAVENKVGPGLASLIEGGTKEVGRTAGEAVAAEGGGQLESILSGHGSYNPLTAHHAAQMAAGILPFKLLDIPKFTGEVKKDYASRVGEVDAATQQAATQSMAQQIAAAVTQQREEPPIPPEMEQALNEHEKQARHEAEQFELPNITDGQLRAQFTPKDVSDGFGTVGAEHTNETVEKPFGVSATPTPEGKLLPGNTLLQRMPKVLPESEWKIYQDAGVEGFLKNKRVSQQDLNQWFRDNGPKVEVRTMSADYSPEEKLAYQKAGELQHSIETAGFAITSQGKLGKPGSDLSWERDNPNVPKAVWQMYDEHQRVQNQIDTFEDKGGTTKWGGIAPKDEASMPGYVEGAVTIPTALTKADRTKFGLGPKQEGESIKFPSSHSFPPNTVGFFRGYIETDPTSGRKTFHVIELQSDWAKDVRNAQESGGRRVNVQNDPLLKDWERLTLKAAVQHSIKSGADRIALSDAETGMMTEGHDRSGNWQAPVGSEGIDPRINNTEERLIPQSKGMRLHYDEILPRVLKELTGYEGKKVSFGEHKNTRDYDEVPPPERGQEDFAPKRKDLIFKNADGTPKTDVSARSYPLDKAYKYQLERGGYGLFTRDKILSIVTQLSKMSMPSDQLAVAAKQLQHLPIRKGESLADAVWRMAGLNEELMKPGHEQELFASAQKFFRTMTKLQGFNNAESEFLTQHALSVAAKFAPSVGQTRVVKSADTASFSLSPRGKNWNALVGILPSRWSTDKSMQHFGDLWSLGHELIHQVEYAASAKDPRVPEWARSAYAEVAKNAPNIRPERKAELVSTLINNLTGNKEFGQKAAKWRQDVYTGPEGNQEFIADVGGLVAMGARRSETVGPTKDLLFFGNKETMNLTHSIIRSLSNGLSLAKEFLGKLGGKTDELDKMVENTHKILASKDLVDKAVGAFQNWEYRFKKTVDDAPPVVSCQKVEQWNRAYTGFAQHVLDSGFPFSRMETPEDLQGLLKDAEKQTSRAPEKFGGPRIGLFQKMIPQEQLAREIPEWRTIADIAHMSDSIVTSGLMRSWQPWYKNGQPDVKLIRTVSKGKTGAAYNAIALAQNTKKGLLTPEEKNALPSYASLSDAQKKDVDTAHDRSSAALQGGALLRIENQKNSYGAAVGALLQFKNKNLNWKDAETAGRALVNFQFNPEDPEAVQAVNKLGLPPEVTAGALDLAESYKDSFQNLQKVLLGEDLKGKPWYHPEVRLGDWHLTWKDENKELHYESYDTQKQGQKKLAELRDLESQGKAASIQHFNKKDIRAKYQGIDNDTFEAYRKADEQALEQTLRRISDHGNPEWATFEQTFREMFSPGEGAAAALVSPYMRERRLVAGRENLNMMEQVIHYLNATAYGTSKSYLGNLIRLGLNSPGVRENPNIYAEGKKYLNNVLYPGGSELTSLKNLNFFAFQGFNPSSNLVVFLHQALRHAPELMRQGFGIGETYKAIGSSFLTVGKARINGKYADPELQSAVDRAVANRVIDKGINTEVYSEEDLNRLNARSLIGGNGKIAEAADLAGNAAYHTIKLARNIYAMSTEFNAEAAFTSSYKLARSRGLPASEAEKFAESTVRVTTMGGGRYNRPLELQGLGEMTGLGGLMYHMASYEAGAIAQMARYTREAIGVLPTESRPAAMRAAAASIGSQLLLGGVLGLPFMAASIDIVDAIFHTQIKRQMRQTFFNLANQDEDMGHVVADMGMRGVLSGVGLGIGQRLELGRLFGVDPDSGKWDLGEEMLGPLGSLITSYTKAAMYATQGRFDTAMAYAAPSGIRNLVKMYNDGGDVRDANKDLLFKPTPGEQVLRGLGFQPSRLSDYYEEQQMKLQSEKSVALDQQNFHRQLGSRLLEGDFSGVRDSLYQRQQEMQGNYDVTEGAKLAVQAAQDQSIPKDPTRAGSRAGAESLSAIGQMYERPDMPTEVQRVLARGQMERELGVPGVGIPNMGEIKQAALVDQLLAQNPTLSRPQALKMVGALVNPRQTVMGYGPQGFQHLMPQR